MITVYGAIAPREDLKGLIRDLRPLWLLEELGAPYDRVALDPRQGQTQSSDYLKLNPVGKIPTITDGDFAIFESAAICEYLAEKYQKLIPKLGSPEYYQVRQWNYWFVSNIEPHAGRVFGCDKIYEKGATNDHVRKLATDILERFFTFLESHFEKSQFMLPSGFSVTDIIFGSGLVYLRTTELLDKRPNMRRYLDLLYNRPAYIKVRAANGLA